jgi:hypothetical protein
MAMPTMVTPYGLRSVYLRPVAADGTVGTGYKLPAGRIFQFKDKETFSELRGDDALQAIHGSGAVPEWALESGGIDLNAYKVIAGGTTVSTGISPAGKLTYSKGVADARPYFQVEGQVISDSGGDFHALLYRCKADQDIAGDMGDGVFYLSKCAGKCMPSILPTAGKIYDFIQNETAIATVP